MSDVVYNSFLKGVADGSIDLGGTIKLVLVGSSYVPDRDAHAFRDDLSDEKTGTNWPAGGKPLAGVTLTQDDANDRAVLGANNLTTSNVSIAGVRAAVAYISTGDPATDPLIAYLDFGEEKTATNTFLTLAFGAGIVRWRQSTL